MGCVAIWEVEKGVANGGGGECGSEGVHLRAQPVTATKAGGTLPTGMHSCFNLIIGQCCN